MFNLQLKYINLTLKMLLDSLFARIKSKGKARLSSF